MSTNDTNVVHVVVSNTDINPVETCEFTQEQIVEKVVSVFGNKSSEILPEEALMDETFKQMIIFVLRKEKEERKAVAMADAKKMLERMLNGTVVNKPNGDDKATRISRVNKYQIDNHGVVSPNFVYDDVNMAATWRRYLINMVVPLQKLEKSFDKESADWKLVASKRAYLQKFIDAVNTVLQGFYKVDIGYHTPQDLREQVDMKLFMDSEYTMYQDMIHEISQVINKYNGQSAEEEGKNPQNKPHGKKKFKK